MKQFILFLHGKYAKRDLSYYRSLCKGKKTVAVDGGYEFFKQARFVPDILIGDFDSLKTNLKRLPAKIQIVRHPEAKDKTDAEIAVDHCIAGGAERIELVQPSFGEPDQFMGNMMLLTQYALYKRNPSYVCLSIVNREYEAFAIRDGRYWIKGKPGEMISIMPMTDQIKLSWSGTSYDVDKVVIARGESRALRNSFQEKKAEIRITGLALLVHQFGPGLGSKLKS